MSVTVINAPRPAYSLTTQDMVDGRAYENVYGAIFIANSYGTVRAYGICGERVAFKFDDPTRFREVNLEIRVV